MRLDGEGKWRTTGRTYRLLQSSLQIRRHVAVELDHHAATQRDHGQVVPVLGLEPLLHVFGLGLGDLFFAHQLGHGGLDGMGPGLVAVGREVEEVGRKASLGNCRMHGL